MDGAAVSILRNLPDDLRDRGWTILRRASKVHTPDSGSPRYIAVFVRPFEPLIDQTRLPGASIRNGYVRVSTNQPTIESWEEAHRYAIECMRAVDATRARRE